MFLLIIETTAPNNLVTAWYFRLQSWDWWLQIMASLQYTREHIVLIQRRQEMVACKAVSNVFVLMAVITMKTWKFGFCSTQHGRKPARQQVLSWCRVGTALHDHVAKLNCRAVSSLVRPLGSFLRVASFRCETTVQSEGLNSWLPELWDRQPMLRLGSEALEQAALIVSAERGIQVELPSLVFVHSVLSIFAAQSRDSAPRTCISHMQMQLLSRQWRWHLPTTLVGS